MRVVDLGRVAYVEALAMQEAQLARRLAGEDDDVVLLCEHDPVYTVGRKRGASANVLAAGDVPVVEVTRGGDVTFHGPGQVVAYPIIALAEGERDLHVFMRRLEQVMIEVCASFGLTAGRDDRNTGAWIGGRKVGSVGIACRRWVTWHGMALNVTTDLAWFERINPCGFAPSIMTTMARERDGVLLPEVRERVTETFRRW